MTERAAEVKSKLAMIRQSLETADAGAVRLRGTDWFAWATAGGSNTVLLAQEVGIAEVLVSATDAWILTDEIEAARLRNEELTPVIDLQVFPWEDALQRERFVTDNAAGKRVLSDRPQGEEQGLPAQLIARKRTLMPGEIKRYRKVGRLAAAAMTEVMLAAQPGWSEYELAGAGAEAMWARGLHPALTLAAGERRVLAYRHPVPSENTLDGYAMLVFCARKYGLYANLTRFVSFRKLSPAQTMQHRQIMEIEAIALDATQAGNSLDTVYAALADAYAARGWHEAIKAHHQGGTTGYLAREIVATPSTPDRMAAPQAYAWNPSVPGVKVEDTFLLGHYDELDNLTSDAAWPSVKVQDRLRPWPMER
ncbi:MAG: M24 family metallopeptidase [Burkholderiales bacterium]